MKITESEVRYVADLANLKLTDSEITRLAKDMDEILTHMDALSELDTSAVEPMAQVLYQSEETATLREDQPVPPLGNEIAHARHRIMFGDEAFRRRAQFQQPRQADLDPVRRVRVLVGAGRRSVPRAGVRRLPGRHFADGLERVEHHSADRLG